MARIRTIKPEFFRSRSLARCSIPARLTFAGLWCEADDHGHGVADPRILKGVLWPLDDEIDPAGVAGQLHELAETEHITLYEVDGEPYYEIVHFEAHQSAAYRRGEAKYPPPPALTQLSMIPHDDACKEVQESAEDCKIVLEGKGREGNMEGKGEPLAPIPARVARGDRNRVFDALVAEFGPAEPKARASLYAKVAGEIIDIAGSNVSADEVGARARAVRKLFGEKAGVRAVSMHWHDTPLDTTPGWMRGIALAAEEASHGSSNGGGNPALGAAALALSDDPPV